MTIKDSEFQKKLLATFGLEAEEHLKALSSGLIDLEKLSSSEEHAAIVERLFREAHTLKGASRAVSLREMEALARALENVFGVVKSKESSLSPNLFDLLHQTVDQLGQLAVSGEAGVADHSRLNETIRNLEQVAKGGEILPEKKPAKSLAGEEPQSSHSGDIPVEKPAEREAGGDRQPEATPPGAEKAPTAYAQSRPPASTTFVEPPVLEETVRLSSAKLASLLYQTEQLFSAKLSAAHNLDDLKVLQRDMGLWKKEHAKFLRQNQPWRAGAKKEGPSVQEGALIEFLESNQQRITALENRLDRIRQAADQHHRFLDTQVNETLDQLKRILMLPVSSVLEMLPKLVRDLSRDQGKQVELVIDGGDIQIDKRILDEIRVPLMHLIRNAIDHGIESPDVRMRKGKPAHGRILVVVAQKDTDKVDLLVADDGAGMDAAALRAAAQKRGLITPSEAERMTRQETLSLIFRSGVTTSPIITDISGRGLGIPIVREMVTKVNGVVLFETDEDVGTTFHLVLPLSLATFRGILIRLGEGHFIVPTVHVHRVLRLDRNDIKTVENRETILLDARVVALAKLSQLLGISGPAKGREPPAKLPIVVVCEGEQQVAVAVDEIVGEQEALMKLFGKQLSRVRNVAGAMLSGTGNLVPILNVRDLIASARHLETAPPAAVPAEAAPIGVKAASLLVVEDSITTRMLLKNILEAAGYAVKTAVNGVDALAQLRLGEFDLVVSDVAMPRMDGFELTSRMRADMRLSETPVVLVTALESREDKERGIEVGANAYIVKSSFDQSNLLETIERLI